MNAKQIAMARASKRFMKLVILRVPLWLVYALGFIPAIWYFYLGVIDELGADPMKTLERALGLWALRFLIACLTVTPLRQSFGVNLLRYRRQLGLLAFYYAMLHLTVYLVLDQSLGDMPDAYFEGGDHESLVHVSGRDFLKLMADAPRRIVSHRV